MRDNRPALMSASKAEATALVLDALQQLPSRRSSTLVRVCAVECKILPPSTVLPRYHILLTNNSFQKKTVRSSIRCKQASLLLYVVVVVLGCSNRSMDRRHYATLDSSSADTEHSKTYTPLLLLPAMSFSSHIAAAVAVRKAATAGIIVSCVHNTYVTEFDVPRNKRTRYRVTSPSNS